MAKRILNKLISKEKEGIVRLVYFGIFYCISIIGDALAQASINSESSSIISVFGYNLITWKFLYGLLRGIWPIASAVFLIDRLNEKIDYLKNRTILSIILLFIIIIVLYKMFNYADPLEIMKSYGDQNTITQH